MLFKNLELFMCVFRLFWRIDIKKILFWCILKQKILLTNNLYHYPKHLLNKIEKNSLYVVGMALKFNLIELR